MTRRERLRRCYNYEELARPAVYSRTGFVAATCGSEAFAILTLEARELVHEAGGRVHVHSHGSVKGVFQGFVDMGVDVLHPIEPTPSTTEEV